MIGSTGRDSQTDSRLAEIDQTGLWKRVRNHVDIKEWGVEVVDVQRWADAQTRVGKEVHCLDERTRELNQKRLWKARVIENPVWDLGKISRGTIAHLLSIFEATCQYSGTNDGCPWLPQVHHCWQGHRIRTPKASWYSSSPLENYIGIHQLHKARLTL